MKIRIIIFSLIFFLVTPHLYGQEVSFDITKRRLTKIKLAIKEFQATGQSDINLSEKLLETITADLTLVDYFQPLRQPADAELVLHSSYNLIGNKLTLEGKLYEATKGQIILAKRFSGNKDQYRKLIHALTDSITTTVTGEPGIAQTRLAFEKVKEKNKQILISDFDGAGQKQVTRDKCPNLFPNWSPSGNILVYTSYIYGYPQTFTYNLNKGERKRVCGYPGLNTSAAFSPNGKMIALTLSKDGNPEIYVINSDGSGLKRITNDRAVDTSPTWAPDGQQLAFVSDRNGRPQIYIVDINRKNPKRVTFQGAYNTNPCWSPRGDLIVYNSYQGGSFQIQLLDLKSGEVTPVSSGHGSYESPSFAPDGRHIVCSVTKGHQSALYLMDIYYKEPHLLNTGAGNCSNPDWEK